MHGPCAGRSGQFKSTGVKAIITMVYCPMAICNDKCVDSASKLAPFLALGIQERLARLYSELQHNFYPGDSQDADGILPRIPSLTLSITADRRSGVA